MDIQLLHAEELGKKMEIVTGLPKREASPFIRHQLTADCIHEPIRKTDSAVSCDSFHVTGIYVELPNGSLKRPNISFFS